MWRSLPPTARVLVVVALVAALLIPYPAPVSVRLRPLAAPNILVLQPDPANGSDTSIYSLSPAWNFGDNATLTVGPNSTTGDLARSLVSFNVAGLPSNALIQNATLSLYSAGGGGGVQARTLYSPWTEGEGGHSWVMVPITVQETAGVNRTLEPVRVTIPFAPNSIVDPARDLRVYDGGAEVPSQIYNRQYVGGRLTSADLYFDVTLGALRSKVFDVVYSTNGTVIPAYRTRGFSASPIWVSNSTGGGASGSTIADLFGNGQLEVVFGGADGYVYCLNNQGKLLWRTLVSPGHLSVPFTPQVADIDHSGRPSIIAVTNDPAIVRLNSTGSIVWRYSAPMILMAGATLVDINGDGVLDVLAAGNSKVMTAVDGNTGTQLATSFTFGGTPAWPTIADLDGSGSPEIVATSYDKNVYAFTLAGTQLWATAASGAAILENAIGFADLTGNGVKEIVTGDGGQNSDAFALYASNHSVAWSNVVGKGFFSGLAIGDLDANGDLETLMGDYRGSMFAFQPNGQTLWPAPYSASSVAPGSPALADLTKSGYPNIVYLDDTSLVVLDRTGALVQRWTIAANNPNPRQGYPMTNPAIADLTGNGTLDIVVPTGNGTEAFATPGLDHDWRTWGYNLNHTQTFLDGASGLSAPLLAVTLGTAQFHPATGASWNYEDGATPWSTPGADFGSPLAVATGVPGWMNWSLTSLVQGWVSGSTPNHGVVLTESSEIAGVLHHFVSSDSPATPFRPTLTIAYFSIAGNSPPQIVGTIPDVVLPENGPPWSINLKAYANDTSTPLDQLRWNVTGFNGSTVQIDGLNVPGNSILTITPQPNRWGSAWVTYWLSDPQGKFARQSAWINITFVNQPPTFNPPSVLFVRYNQTYVFDFGPYVNDPDTPRSGLTLTSDDAVHTRVSGFNVSFDYPFSYLNQWAFVNLTVSDGVASVTRVVAIQVTSDYPPVLTDPLPDVTLYEGQSLIDVFNLADHFADPNQDALFFSTGSTHVNVTIHANLSVDIRAPIGWWGQEAVTFHARDPTGAIAEDTILVTVLHVDQPPAIGPVPDLRVRFGTPYLFNLDPYLSDPDTPSSQLIVTVTDSHVFVSGHLLTFLYPASYNNTVQAVAITVSDGAFNTSRAILVAVGADWPPTLKAKMPDRSFPENTVDRAAYNLSLYFSDPDGTPLYWSSGNQSILVTLHANGSVDLSALPNWHGTERITFRATDAQGALDEDSVWITVTPVDQAPYFLPVPRQILNQTTAYLPLFPFLRDADTNLSDLVLVSTNSTHAVIIGQGILLTYSAEMTDHIRVVVSDGQLTNATTIVVLVQLTGPTNTVTEILPGWFAWILLATAGVLFASFVVYRRRQLEWAFLVTNDGLLVSSISRRGPGDLDTDLLTGMLTTIMDFARKSFSDEKERNLEGLELGEKRVAIARGDKAFLAVVYRGRTPGRLLAIMHSLLTQIEKEHADALGDIVDTAKLEDVPLLLQKLVSRGNLPFVSFRPKRPASN